MYNIIISIFLKKLKLLCSMYHYEVVMFSFVSTSNKFNQCSNSCPSTGHTRNGGGAGSSGSSDASGF